MCVCVRERERERTHEAEALGAACNAVADDHRLHQLLPGNIGIVRFIARL